MFALPVFVLILTVGVDLGRAATATPVGCVDLRKAPSGGKTVGNPGGSANCMVSEAFKVTRRYTATPVLSAPSNADAGVDADAQNACAGYSYFYWQQSGDYCYCLDSAGTLDMYVPSAAIDDMGTCRSDYAAVSRRLPRSLIAKRASLVRRNPLKVGLQARLDVFHHGLL